MGRKWRGQVCHYQCGRPATTLDHIVARVLYRKVAHRIPMSVHQANVVPCCTPCNDYKKWFRSECNCETCLTAWVLLSPYILPRVKKDIPLIKVIGTVLVTDEEETG
jgi:hypothetical protein